MLLEPANPANSKLASTKQYKFELCQYLTKAERCEKTMERVFAIILGQCSCTIRNRMEAAQSWKSNNICSNVFALLALICTCLYQCSTHCNQIHTLLDAKLNLHYFCQSEGMSNLAYEEKFLSLVEIYE